VVVVLETDIDEELVQEGRARELINRIQTLRKELDLDYADRIEVVLEGGPEIEALVAAHGELVRGETLAVSLEIGAPDGGAHVKETELDGIPLRLGLKRVQG
jgi:isoleucyl-tRNA synthetase